MVRRTNQLFTWLLALQALGLVGAATLRGADWLAWGLAAGGVLLFAAVPLALLQIRPGAGTTRYAVGCAQLGFAALFAHFAGPRIDGHVVMFAALAVVALYRDWRLLLASYCAAVAHHAVVCSWLRNTTLGGDEGWSAGISHAALLLLECAALAWAGLATRREMLEISRREDQHQSFLDQLEERVRERTKHLEAETAERERTAQVLRQNEERHRHLIATLPIGIFETTRDGKVNFANPYLLGLIGLPAHFDPTVISLADGRIFPALDRERLWHRLENERDVRGFATTLRHFDGSAFDVVINARLKTTVPGAELVCEGTVEDVTVRKRAERELEVLHGQLMLASRQAGMAEVATGVLHNVGNVMTSVNLIVHDVQDRLKTTRLAHLHRVVEVLQREGARLAEFLATDPAGQKLPDFLAKLDEHLSGENRQLLTDVESLVRHFEHIREIIVTQQGSAQLFGVIETLSPSQLFEDALRLNAESLERHGIRLERVFEPTPPVKADRHKVLQILVNLLKNAKDALQALKPGERSIRVRVKLAGSHVALSVEDNGPGIAAQNLTRIFQHGFTTKPSGHGYGLHSSVLAAREMGGDLNAASEGAGRGSTFTLTLPTTAPASR